MEEKIKLLSAAMKQVDKAIEAIDAFAEAYGLPKPGGEVSIGELAYLVGKETGGSPFCAEETLRCAFRLMHDLDLTITEKEDENDE